MVVARRQRREKSMKIEQRKVQGVEWAPQAKQAALQAGPVYRGQAWGEGKTHKKRNQNGAAGFSALRVFWVSPPSLLKGVLSFFFFLIKLSYNTGQSVASIFCCSKTELRKLHTPPTYMLLWLTFNLVQTTSAQPPRGGGQTQQKPNLVKAPMAEAECEENPAQWKWQEA